LTEVEPFLAGKKNPFDYYIKPINRLGNVSYTLTRKETLDINYLRDVKAFLLEVKAYNRGSEANVLIENIIKDKKLRISVNPGIKSLLYDGTDAEIDTLNSFINTPVMHLFFTKKHDPHFLIETITINPKMLFDSDVQYIDYKNDLSNASVFTKQLLDGYGYIIR